MTSTEKLVAALTEAKAPAPLIERARRDEFNDYNSASATPCVDLVAALTHEIFEAEKVKNKLLAIELTEVLDMAKDGMFDATKEESDAWVERMKTEDPGTYKMIQQLKLE